MLITEPADLGPRQLTSTEPIELAQPLLDRLQKTRYAVLAALGTGDPVYGVNTGMGAMSKRRLTEDEQRVHQRNLLLGRAAGGPPWLPLDEARAVVVARLRTFLTGDAGVSPELCLQLVALLNSGKVPAIPIGGAGSAGEIIPLAHAFGPLVGIGSIARSRRCGQASRRCVARVRARPEGRHLVAGGDSWRDRTSLASSGVSAAAAPAPAIGCCWLHRR